LSFFWEVLVGGQNLATGVLGIYGGRVRSSYFGGDGRRCAQFSPLGFAQHVTSGEGAFLVSARSANGRRLVILTGMSGCGC
jgi:hypothetical protein